MTFVYQLTERVKELVAHAPAEALTTAMTIEPPSGRVYALAFIIRHAPGGVVRQALNEAHAAARACPDLVRPCRRPGQGLSSLHCR